MRTFIVNCLKVICVASVIFMWICIMPVIGLYAVYNGLRYGEWDADVWSDCYKAWRETWENYKHVWADVE